MLIVAATAVALGCEGGWKYEEAWPVQQIEGLALQSSQEGAYCVYVN
jgi:hypothetical protein